MPFMHQGKYYPSVIFAIFVILLTGNLFNFKAQNQFEPEAFSGLQWRMIGPFRGGRVNGVSGVPGEPNTFYFGSVGGGVWKSTNSGRTWKPVFDDQPIASIGAIGVAPTNGNITAHAVVVFRGFPRTQKQLTRNCEPSRKIPNAGVQTL